MDKYDAVIVGAGSAGTLAAKAISSAGCTTLLLDSKRKNEIGDKVCGDAIGSYHLDRLGLKDPRNGAFEQKVKGIKVYSPDKESVFTFTNPNSMGHIVNRHVFGQWLLNEALDSGTELLDSTVFMESIIKQGKVNGIKAKSKQGNKITLEAKVVIDASGHNGVVRNNLPLEMGFTRRLKKEDVDVCYREVRQLDQKLDDTEYCHIYLNQKNTPGGYTWVFPRRNAQANIGLGINQKENLNPRTKFYNTVISLPIMKNSTIIHKGGGIEPTRRPLDRLVGNGIMLIGDAACLVNPINGGGLGISMESGYIAGQTVVDALEKGGAMESNLWPYACTTMEGIGKELANLDILRRCISALDDKHLDYGMKKGILTDADLMQASRGEKTGYIFNFVKLVKGLRYPRMLNKFRITATYMRQVVTHYENYPSSPFGFLEWQEKTEDFFQQVRTKI